MSSSVFANGREISAKKQANQSIAAMPDPCLSPPSPPAGPVPIPYPNFSQASDTSNGTKTVKIQGGEAGIKDSSDYSTSKGNEAATRTLGMGVVTHTIQGKTKFAAWSFDVQFEGKNVTRQMDLTTHNHNNVTNGASAPSVAQIAIKSPKDPECQELANQNKNFRRRTEQTGETGTVTHGNYTPKGGSPQPVWGTSGSLSTAYQNRPGKCTGQPYTRRTGGETKTGVKKKRAEPTNIDCAKAKKRGWRYRPNKTTNTNNPDTGHTESKIVEDIFAGRNGLKPPPGKLTLSINWKSEAGNDDKPCPNCQRLVCAAAACGLEITICTDNEEVQNCPKDLSPE
ncbi:MAG TPA: DUF4150 domain-containing protein [Vicinamibacterales bacterium]|nr:DUF4150 domain-containing protein [Vicinamibacterales bacterium]